MPHTSRARFGRAGLPLILLTALLASCADSPTEPAAPLAAGERPALAASSAALAIDLWTPVDQSAVGGTQYVKAVLPGYSIGSYDMYWRVDDGPWYKLYTSYTGGAHKEAQYGVNGWSWNGTGPYTMQVRAQTKAGAVLALTSRRIFIDRPHLNLFPGSAWYVDPYSHARQQADAWRATRPADAELMARMGRGSQADWFGDWSGDVYAAARRRVAEIRGAGALPVFVAYNIPVRDCNGYSGGGAASGSAYLAWIGALADGIGTQRAVVILEPDGLPLLDCLSASARAERISLLRSAIQTLKKRAGISVYVDAGNSGWHAPETIAERLLQAGLGFADGFALNVSNFYSTADNAAYGQAVSRLTGGKHFVIDTSRNGAGPETPYEWCNSAGRALGSAPTWSTGYEGVDALLWIKRPGESDGTCAGGPSAGGWWPEYALGLASRAAAAGLLGP